MSEALYMAVGFSGVWGPGSVVSPIALRGGRTSLHFSGDDMSLLSFL